MIKYSFSPGNIVVSGENKMDFALFLLPILIISVIAGMAIMQISRTFIGQIIVIVITIGILTLIFKTLIRFKIRLTGNTIKIKKTFFGISYFTIEKVYSAFEYHESVIIFSGEEGKMKIVDDKGGFDPDCLLICLNGKAYELANEKDSPIIFNYLLQGIEYLK